MSKKNEFKKKFRNASEKVTITQLHKSLFSESLLKQLEGRESFIDADKDLAEKMYTGDVFEAIACDLHGVGSTNEDLIDEVDALAEIISTEYVQIIEI